MITFHEVTVTLSLVGVATIVYLAIKAYKKAKAGVVKVEAVVEQVKKDL